MDYPVVHEGREIGCCSLTDQGLYWNIVCSCEAVSNKVERLYAGSIRLDVLERMGDRLQCQCRRSKRSVPDLPPSSGVFTLRPQKALEEWHGTLLGKPCSGYRDGEWLLFPYEADKPCPCEPLICFFAVKNGYWVLPFNETWIKKEPDGA